MNWQFFGVYRIQKCFIFLFRLIFGRLRLRPILKLILILILVILSFVVLVFLLLLFLSIAGIVPEKVKVPVSRILILVLIVRLIPNRRSRLPRLQRRRRRRLGHHLRSTQAAKLKKELERGHEKAGLWFPPPPPPCNAILQLRGK